MKFGVVKKLINFSLSIAGGLLAFVFLSTFFVLIKSDGTETEIFQTLPPHYLPYYFGFVVISIVAGYVTLGFIHYFEKNFGDIDNMPSSRNILSKNYKSSFLKHYVQIAGVLYVCFLITGFLVRFRNSELGENFLIWGSLIAMFGSVPVAYFLSKKGAEK